MFPEGQKSEKQGNPRLVWEPENYYDAQRIRISSQKRRRAGDQRDGLQGWGLIAAATKVSATVPFRLRCSPKLTRVTDHTVTEPLLLRPLRRQGHSTEHQQVPSSQHPQCWWSCDTGCLSAPGTLRHGTPDKGHGRADPVRPLGRLRLCPRETLAEWDGKCILGMKAAPRNPIDEGSVYTCKADAHDLPPIHREANMHTKQVRLEMQYSRRHTAINAPHGALPPLPCHPCQLPRGSGSTLA